MNRFGSHVFQKGEETEPEEVEEAKIWVADQEGGPCSGAWKREGPPQSAQG